jgi:hypothetical protein
MFDDLIKGAALYYTQKVERHGATPQGADWNSAESQELRFRQLLHVCRLDQSFSLNDYGCGYGALLHFLREHSRLGEYCGFDASEMMLREAWRFSQGISGAAFVSDRSLLLPRDFTVASGIFNVKQDTAAERWREYAIATIEEMNSLSNKGFSFNMLTSYSDPERMREDLFYGDPCFFFDYAKRKFAKDVYLLHDYGLYEFTIGVRKEPA